MPVGAQDDGIQTIGSGHMSKLAAKAEGCKHYADQLK